MTPLRTRRVWRPQKRCLFWKNADISCAALRHAGMDSASFERSISSAVETISRIIILLLQLLVYSCNQPPPQPRPNKPTKSLDHAIGGECLQPGLELRRDKIQGISFWGRKDAHPPTVSKKRTWYKSRGWFSKRAQYGTNPNIVEAVQHYPKTSGGCGGAESKLLRQVLTRMAWTHRRSRCMR